ncbi:SRPBCC domain-containing protein [Aeromicrobium wangtongii]|uniref:SRPBCC domain-containing protein n=1 Tax=Aeromicrobium wangtongii TaxID=2969247 RepID=UPI00201779B6|nr:SRPBCC domain-containing protein [Aeromicrobium wangtongii]MCL3817216.1 SRPBCC domain-containing protein [Aeromicrobium wangtongii]
MSTTRNDVTINDEGTHAITIVREFDHPVDKVFRAMTQPELIARWIGPYGYDNVEVTNDAAHGGTWTLVQRNDDGEHRFRGVFHGDATPELTLRTFEWLGLPGHVSFESQRIEDLGDGRSRSHVTSVFMTAEDRDGMRASGMDHGVIEGYERLDDVLAQM